MFLRDNYDILLFLKIERRSRSQTISAFLRVTRQIFFCSVLPPLRQSPIAIRHSPLTDRSKQRGEERTGATASYFSFSLVLIYLLICFASWDEEKEKSITRSMTHNKSPDQDSLFSGGGIRSSFTILLFSFMLKMIDSELYFNAMMLPSYFLPLPCSKFLEFSIKCDNFFVH